MIDEEKLEETKEAFRRKLDEIETWDDFKILLNNITKQRVINFIKNNLEQSASRYRNIGSNCTGKGNDIDNLVEEVDAI